MVSVALSLALIGIIPLIHNIVPVGSLVQATRSKPTLIVYEDDEDDDDVDEIEHSDGSSCSEGLEDAPTNLPESVDVDDEFDTEPEDDLDPADADALEGADVFKDVKIEVDPFVEEMEQEVRPPTGPRRIRK